MSIVSPTPAASDRNLLFGILALQMDFVQKIIQERQKLRELAGDDAPALVKWATTLYLVGWYMKDPSKYQEGLKTINLALAAKGHMWASMEAEAYRIRGALLDVDFSIQSTSRIARFPQAG